MIEKSGQLLCTFSNVKMYEAEIKSLLKVYKIVGNRIYVLSNLSKPDDVFLTFNGIKLSSEYYPHTISVHRKREYNVLYSINALNELTKLEEPSNNSPYKNISWDRYRNSVITVKDGKLKITPTKLVKIFPV